MIAILFLLVDHFFIGLLRFLVYELKVAFSQEDRFYTMRKCRKGLSIRNREYPYL